MTDCIFCRIVAGEIPATIVARNADAVAFRDLSPQAPTHLLVVPVAHHDSAATAGGGDPAVLGAVVALAVRVAAELGVAQSGYRMVVNTGRDGGQTVEHLHLHLLAGRQMHWPPG
jgi:histidine triad (HIT) family protein